MDVLCCESIHKEKEGNNMNTLTTLQQAITEIDILSPPKQYIREILRAVCERLGYRFGSVIEIDAHTGIQAGLLNDSIPQGIFFKY